MVTTDLCQTRLAAVPSRSGHRRPDGTVSRNDEFHGGSATRQCSVRYSSHHQWPASNQGLVRLPSGLAGRACDLAEWQTGAVGTLLFASGAATGVIARVERAERAPSLPAISTPNYRTPVARQAARH